MFEAILRGDYATNIDMRTGAIHYRPLHLYCGDCGATKGNVHGCHFWCQEKDDDILLLRRQTPRPPPWRSLPAISVPIATARAHARPGDDDGDGLLPIGDTNVLFVPQRPLWKSPSSKFDFLTEKLDVRRLLEDPNTMSYICEGGLSTLAFEWSRNITKQGAGLSIKVSTHAATCLYSCFTVA